METTIISVFYDIKISNIKSISSEPNFINFKSKIKELKNNLILFVDDRYIDDFLNLPLSTIIPINNDWLIKNIETWRYIDNERKILNNPKYKQLLSERIEKKDLACLYPEHNIFSHSKIDFINYASLWYDIEHIIWIDFDNFIKVDNINVIDNDLFNIFLNDKLDQNDLIPKYVLSKGLKKFNTSYFYGNSVIMSKIQYEYHKIIEEFRSIGIADDDSHIFLIIYFRCPELFNLLI